MRTSYWQRFTHQAGLAVLLRAAIVAALLAALALAAACSDDNKEGNGTTVPGGFDGTIKIGQILDRTGAAGGSPITLSFPLGLEKAIKDINAAGGAKVGGKSYKLELIALDSKTDPTVVVADTQQLLDAGVIAVDLSTAPFFQQAYQILKPANKIVFTVGPQGLDLMERLPNDNPLLSSPIELATPIIIGWGKQMQTINPNVGKRIGYLAQDDPLGRAMEEPNRKTAAEIGGTFVGAIYFPLGTTDFSTFVTNMKAMRPDIIYTYGGASLLELTISALQLDAAPTLEIPGFLPALFPLLPPLGTHTIYAVDWRLPFTTGLVPAQYKDAVDSLGQIQGGLPRQTGFAIAYHDYVYLLIEAMKKANSVTDTKAIAAAMPGTTYDGPYGKVTMLPDRSTRGTMGMIQVTTAGFKVFVYPNVGETRPSITFDAPPNAIAAPTR